MISVLERISTPSNWTRTPFGRLVTRSKVSGHPELPPLSVYLDEGVVLRSSRDDNHNRLGEDIAKYLVVRPGDLVFNRLRTWQGGFGVSRHEGIVSPAYFVCRPQSTVEPRFLHYLMKSAPYLAELTRVSKFMPPSQFDILWGDLRDIPVALPPSEEQRAIADHLDAETARIDALIAARRSMLLLLEERWRSFLVDRLFGRRIVSEVLNADRPTLPAAWQERTLLDLTDRSVPIVYGILLPGPRLDEGVPYLGAGDVSRGRLQLDHLPRTTREIASEYPRSRVRAGELVYAIRGSVGAVEQVPNELDGVNLSRDAARICPGKHVDARWLLYALKSELAQEQFRRRTVGATITGVNIEDLKKVRLLVPPISDQRALAAELDAAAALHDRMVVALDRQVSLLREHRLALITAAVTGELEITGVK